jgi:hypothetical protein
MQLLIIFIASGVLKLIAAGIFGVGVMGLMCGIVIDIAVVGVIYLLLRQNYYYLNLNKIMAIIIAITLLSILMDIGILPAGIGNLLVLAVLGWMLFNRGGWFR